MASGGDRKEVLIIGAGLYGLVTAKTLLHDSWTNFDTVDVYEKNDEIGGVWASDRIYSGLCTNSPLLTYEIPDYPYAKEIRHSGRHVTAQEVNCYLKGYAERFQLNGHIHLRHFVDDVSWDIDTSRWVVIGRSQSGSFSKSFSHLIVCHGLYHSPFVPQCNDLGFSGKVWHSSQVGYVEVQKQLAGVRRVTVVGAGKSAIDLATLIARGQWNNRDAPPKVNLVWRRPHWLSPRKIIRGRVPFENLLFSRFVNAWLPYETSPDIFHRLITETKIGRWCTYAIFKLVENDFLASLKQFNVPQTIPDHPLAVALSGALHVEPPGYLDSIREGKISVTEGALESLADREVTVRGTSGDSTIIETDHIVMATGYNLSLPFFSPALLNQLGLLDPPVEQVDIRNLPYIRLYKLIVPPTTLRRHSIHSDTSKQLTTPCERIAFNGFAYSLLNPTVAFVTAHWISDYFLGNLRSPSSGEVDSAVEKFHAWQRKSFGGHGAKGVHIGPHATLYTDDLLMDMGLKTGHVKSSMLNPLGVLQQWLRPMLPEIYSDVGNERRQPLASHGSICWVASYS